MPRGAAEYMNISKFPHRVAMINSRIKAEAVAPKVKSGYIIAADTVCLLNRKIIGKPKDCRHAKNMLKEMSDRIVSVYTGISVVDVKNKRMASGYERSDVKVKKMTPKEIERFFKFLGPYDKAGGFSIEGAGSFIFDDIKGSYFNVLGLPMAKLRELFESLGKDILSFVS
jgi:septum formation protein